MSDAGTGCGCGNGAGCGACSVPGGVVVRLDNRPSLPAVAYRRGTFATFRRTLLDRTAREPTLARLSTRESDDHTVATLELWAVVADVLEFYSERYLNEAYLGTATESRSVERLARLVGYRPRPGVAALAWLAFTLDPGASALIAAGTAVQSVPGPTSGGPPPLPVTFETLDPLAASAVWNAIRAYSSAVPSEGALEAGQRRTVLRRADAPTLAGGLRPNDRLVAWSSSGVEEKVVKAIDVQSDRVIIDWSDGVMGTAGSSPQVRTFTRLLRVFGSGAPDSWMKPTAQASAPGGIRWNLVSTSYAIAAGSGSLDLEGKVDDLDVGGSLLVVPSSGAPVLVAITAIGTANAAVGPVRDSVTRVSVTPSLPALDLRSVRVYALTGLSIAMWGGDYPSAALPSVLHVPVFSAPLADGRTGVEIGRRIEAGAWVPGTVIDLEDVEPGRVLLVTWDGTTPVGSRPAPIPARLDQRPALPAFDSGGFGHLRLDMTFTEPLADDWRPVVSVRLLANVVRASHGETVTETLGDGNGTRPFQPFALGRKPLTHLPARAPGGIATTLVVADDGLIRPEVPTLFGQPGTTPVISTATAPDGVTSVLFGDGRTMAARATTGIQNIRARYRVGSGLAGRVPAERLSTLLTRPPGVNGVVNPTPAEGGADPEPRDQARHNAPASVRTLGRIVSLRDVESLVLSSGLVAKAQAIWLWSGFDRVIHLTVAAPEGDPLSSTLRDLIGDGLNAARDTSHRLAIEDRVLVPVTLKANIVIDKLADRPDLVLADALAAARRLLSFDAVSLGIALAVSDMIAALAAVPGVIGVDVDTFTYALAAGFTTAELDERGVERASDGSVAPVQPRLRMWPARAGATRGSVLPAELPWVRVPADVQIVDRGRA